MSALARTVTGAAISDRYDVVLAHEHLHIDIRCWLDETHAPSRQLRDAQVDGFTLEAVRRNPFACLDNLVLGPASLVIGELRQAGSHGRTLIVDVTPENVGRDPGLLADMSRAAQIDVVMGCGLYIDESWAPSDRQRRPEEHRDHILAQFDGPPPHPAVLGEIGTGSPPTPDELSSLRGAAQANVTLAVPLYVHLHPWARHGHQALDVIEAEGADPAKVILCHLDPQIDADLAYHRSLLERGANIAFDIWGDELQYGHVHMPSDIDRMKATLRLIDAGHERQLVHSQDVCTKTQLRRFGGAGYDHLHRVVKPMLLEAGLSPTQVSQQLAGNALALLLDQGDR